MTPTQWAGLVLAILALMTLLGVAVGRLLKDPADREEW